MSKRSASPPSASSSSGGALIKRAKSSNDGPSTSREIAISSNNDPRNKALIRSVQRTSGLDAPIISLAGAHAVSLLLSRDSIFNCSCRGKSFHVVSILQDKILPRALETVPYLYGGRTRHIQITACCPVWLKHQYWTCNGHFSNHLSIQSLQTICLASWT